MSTAAETKRRTYGNWVQQRSPGLGSLGLLVWALGLAGPDWGGGLQRAFNTLADVWWAGLGVVLLRRGADGPGGAE